jgi:putative transposase
MTFKYAVTDQNDIYFITTTVVGWIDVFTRKNLPKLLLKVLDIANQKRD